MESEWQVLIMCIASLLLKVIANGDRVKAVRSDDGPTFIGRSAKHGSGTIEQGLGEKS